MRLLLAFVALPFCAAAQNKPDTTGEPFSVIAGPDLGSSPVYSLSGSDTGFVNEFAVTPMLDVQHRSGLGLRYRPTFLLGSAYSGLQLQQLSLYFERYGEGKWDLDFFYARFFFRKDPSLPQSPLNNEVYGMARYRKTLLMPTLSAAYGFGKAADGSSAYDVSVSGGLSYEYSGSKGVREWNVTPALSVNAGTAGNYSFLDNAQYVTRSKKFVNTHSHKKATPGNPNSGTTTTSTATATGFALRNVELGVYSSYRTGNFEVVPMGSVFIPLQAGDSFGGYWQLGLRYHF